MAAVKFKEYSLWCIYVLQEDFVFSVYINEKTGHFLAIFTKNYKKISILTLAFGHFSYFSTIRFV